MLDLSTQLRDYLDETAPPVELEEIFTKPVGEEPVRPIERRQPKRLLPRWAFGAAAAVVILLLVGGVVWLSRSDPELGPAEQPTVSTPRPTTPSTVAPDSEDPLVDQTPDLVSSLGTLTWTKVEGTRESLPSWWLKADAASGFVSFERADSSRPGQEQPLVWRSEDAVTWTSEQVPELAGYSSVMFEIPSWTDTSEEIDWALAFSGETSTLFQARDSWVPVDLPEPPLPPLSGVVWTIGPEMLTESDGVIVVPASGFARIPWENYYGTRENFGFEAPNWPEWDESSQVMQFFDSSGTMLAELTVGVVGGSLVFTDIGTGDVVHEVGGLAEYLPDLIFQDNGDVDLSVLNVTGMWVSTEGGAFEYQEAPWSGPRYKPDMVLPLPAGGFAAYVVLESEGCVGGVEVWTSEEGVTWVDHGTPAFLENVTCAGDVFVWPWTAGLRAEVLANSGFQAWESIDGLTWTREAVLPPVTRVYETTFGYVAVSMSDYPTIDPNGPFFKFWISHDGVTWEPVEGPPGKHDPDGGGNAIAGGAGDVIYLSVAEESGSRFMWIGRIEPP